MHPTHLYRYGQDDLLYPSDGRTDHDQLLSGLNDDLSSRRDPFVRRTNKNIGHPPALHLLFPYTKLYIFTAVWSIGRQNDGARLDLLTRPGHAVGPLTPRFADRNIESGDGIRASTDCDPCKVCKELPFSTVTDIRLVGSKSLNVRHDVFRSRNNIIIGLLLLIETTYPAHYSYLPGHSIERNAVFYFDLLRRRRR